MKERAFMGFKGFNRRLTGAGFFVFAAAAFAACATGEEPDRSGLLGIGGASSSSGGSTGPGSSSAASSSAGDGSSSSVSSSSSSSSSAGVGGTGGAGGVAGAGGAGGVAGAGGAGGADGVGGAGGAGGVNGAGGMGGAGGSMPDAGSDAPTPTGLRVQYKAADTNASNAEIKPHLNIFNDSPDSVMLSELSIRYWYTIDGGSQTQEFHCDYAKIGCGKITGTFGEQVGVNADHYLQITFAAGEVLAPGANSGEIQARFNKTGFPSFDETNDYSFDPTKLALADWMKVTLYHNGALVWGVEP